MFKKKNPPKSEIAQKFLSMANRFQTIGIALVALAVCIHLAGFTTPALVILIPGAMSLIFGGSNLQSHNIIKSFAQQTAISPNQEMAEAFLEMLERYPGTGLTKSSIKLVQNGIVTYAAQEDADPELVEKLKAAAEKNIKKKIF